eukprot:gene23270-30161_t
MSNSTDIHDFIVAIKQNNLDLLEEILLDISDVNSLNYGNHLSQNDIGNYILNDEDPLAAGTQTVTPTNLRAIYQITGYGSSLATQSIYGSSGQSYLSTDITKFETKYNLLKKGVTTYPNPAPDNSTCKVAYYNCAEASLDLQYILAVANNVTTTYCMSYGSYEINVSSSVLTVFNNEAIKLGLRGVTIVAGAGDDGVTGYAWSTTAYNISQCGFYAMFPASSPYVVAVGGTIGGMETSGTKSQEVAIQSDTTGIITTGGGFSNRFQSLSFMKSAQSKYFSTVTSTITQSKYKPYNSSNRGYPDMSMAASRYQVYINGVIYSLSGTSASAPVFAGLVSLVNSYRIALNYSTLGYMNPSIYSNNGGYARDITSGNNKCTSNKALCCSHGFYCATGWDPLTGFGSVNYTKFLSYYSTKIPGTATVSPTKQPT